jgi:hypothetical protein
MAVSHLVFNVGRKGHLASDDVQLSTEKIDLLASAPLMTPTAIIRFEAAPDNGS